MIGDEIKKSQIYTAAIAQNSVVTQKKIYNSIQFDADKREQKSNDFKHTRIKNLKSVTFSKWFWIHVGETFQKFYLLQLVWKLKAFCFKLEKQIHNANQFFSKMFASFCYHFCWFT